MFVRRKAHSNCSAQGTIRSVAPRQSLAVPTASHFLTEYHNPPASGYFQSERTRTPFRRPVRRNVSAFELTGRKHLPRRFAAVIANFGTRVGKWRAVRGRLLSSCPHASRRSGRSMSARREADSNWSALNTTRGVTPQFSLTDATANDSYTHTMIAAFAVFAIRSAAPITFVLTLRPREEGGLTCWPPELGVASVATRDHPRRSAAEFAGSYAADRCDERDYPTPPRCVTLSRW